MARPDRRWLLKNRLVTTRRYFELPGVSGFGTVGEDRLGSVASSRLQLTSPGDMSYQGSMVAVFSKSLVLRSRSRMADGSPAAQLKGTKWRLITKRIARMKEAAMVVVVLLGARYR